MVKTKYEILKRDNFECQRCGKTTNLELAHNIKQGKGTIKHIINFIRTEYKKEITKKEAATIMHDERNVTTSCHDCNSYFNIFFKPVLRDEKIKEIYEAEFINNT